MAFAGSQSLCRRTSIRAVCKSGGVLSTESFDRFLIVHNEQRVGRDDERGSWA